MPDLKGKIALVTGASRGVGKGVALGLGEFGATVYVTGRTTEGLGGDGLPGTVLQTAEEVSALGGIGIGIPCDHRDDAAVEAVFKRIAEEHGRLDILVNNAWAGYEYMVEPRPNNQWEFTWGKPFWEQPMWRWDAMFTVGVRSAYLASRLAVRLMLPQGRGLITNVSFWAAQKYLGNAAYGASKAAVDKLTSDMAHELREHGVAVLALYPGLVRTESVMRASLAFDLSNSESPQFIGRAVAALAADPNVMARSGQVLIAAALGHEYGFADIDGKQPRPVTLEEA